MRLLSLHLRNYRLHKELRLDFDPARNLIGGPNESGKSTLAEAIHRALFLRAKTGGGLREEMRSSRHQGDPEVTLVFEAAGTRWTLEKRFAGNKGSTLLTDAGGTAHKDDEADVKLAELHQCDTGGGRVNANQLSGFWSHLWVWQGSAGLDPARQAGEHKDTLVQRLQQEGLASVIQSPADLRARERIAAAYHELFTATGKAKAGSKPETARLELEKAETALERALEAATRLEQAAADHQRATQEITEADALLPGLLEQKALTEAKLGEAEKLRRDEDDWLRRWTTAVERRKQLTAQDTAIRILHGQTTAARDALAPAERLEAGLLAEQSRAAELSHTAEAAQRGSSDSIRLARLRHDFIAAWVTAFEKAADHGRMAERAREADALLLETTGLQEELSLLPEITDQELEAIRQLDRSISQADTGLRAMATGIELIAADAAVTLEGQPLSPGGVRTLTDEGLLTVGPGTTVRIRPGGGLSLADARLQLENARRRLTTALDQYTLESVDHATAVLQRRQTISQRMAQLRSAWQSLGGESLTPGLAEAALADGAAQAEARRRGTAFDPPASPPETLETARQWLIGERRALESAEEAEEATRHHAGQHRQRLEDATEALTKHRDLTAQARQSLRELETKHQVLLETHGDDAARAAALTQAALTEQEAAARLAATREALTNLAPDLLTADAERFARAVTHQEARRREAENIRLVAGDRLALDGSSDPRAELAHARASEAAARETHLSQQRRALAIDRLHQLFSSARESIDRSIVQPLADRVSGYLQCLFGPASQVRINISGDGIEGFDLVKAGDPAFHFPTLSGGTKEQVATAVRLAIAEILAAGHGGCLPVVLDDAFAYADPVRVQALQRMLDLAAKRGLQIIVLTCTPTDYSAFGAREIRLA